MKNNLITAIKESEPESEPESDSEVDFDLFLKFMSMCEEAKPEGGEHDKEIFENFKDMIYDLNRTSVCGSSILNHRLNRKPDANDIDFFIEGSSENIDIISAFFHNNYFRLVFKEFNEKYNTKDGIIMDCPTGNFEKTSLDQGYSLLKLDYKMEIYRFGFSTTRKKGFNLNFILPERLSTDERNMIGIGERHTTKLYSGIFLDTDDRFTNQPHNLVFSAIRLADREIEKLTRIFPSGLSLHIINESFDFEELKFVYDFNSHQIITVFDAAKILLEKFSDNVKDLHKEGLIRDKVFSDISDRIIGKINNIEIQNKEFKEMTSNPTALNIATRVVSDRVKSKMDLDIVMYMNGVSIDPIFSSLGSNGLPKIIKECYAAYHNIIARIPKYEKRGFIIVDPDNFVSNLQAYITLHHIYLLSNTTINNISKRTSLLSGDKKSTTLLKINLEAYKLSNTLSENMDILLKKSLEKQEEGGKKKNVEINELIVN